MRNDRLIRLIAALLPALAAHAQSVGGGEGPATQLPPARREWIEDVRARHHAIRSLSSDDFGDLDFLRPVLDGKRVVALGESSHGVAEFGRVKVRLVKYLHEALGYDVIAFESSMAECDMADSHVGRSLPVDVMRECTFPVWHSQETLLLFEYLDQVRKDGGTLALAGFDTQINSLKGNAEVSARMLSMIDASQYALYQRVAAAERRLTDPVVLEEGERAGMESAYADLARYLAENAAMLQEKRSLRPIEVNLAIREAESRRRYVNQRARKPYQETWAIRDEAMADNVGFLLDAMYPGRKVILWAHNYHVAKAHAGSSPGRMGEWIARRRGSEVYVMGLFMGRGIAALNDRKPYAIAPPRPDSLEAVLAHSGDAVSFVDFSQAKAKPGAEWIFQPVPARELATELTTLVPSQSFDGVIYVDTVTPPRYK